MKLYCVSGGATKIPGLFGASETVLLQKNYNPDVIGGISSGGILAVINAMMKEHREIRELTFRQVTSFTMKTFMSKPPFNEKGKLTWLAKWRAATGKPSLGEQGNLNKTLSNIITERHYNDFINKEDKYPDVILGTVDFTDGARKFFNLRRDKLSYEDFLNLTNASAAIPLAVMPVEYKGMTLYDGGVRDHIPTAYILDRMNYKFDSSISVFSRPKNYALGDTNWNIKKKNLVDVMTRTFDIMNVEISKTDEKEILSCSRENNVDSKIVYLTNHMKSLYDTDPKRLMISYHEGVKETREQLNDTIRRS